MTRLAFHRVQCDRCREVSTPFNSKNTRDWVDQVHAAGWRAVPIIRNGTTAYEHRCRACVQQLDDAVEERRW